MCTVRVSQIVKPTTVLPPKPDFVKVYFSRFLRCIYVYFWPPLKESAGEGARRRRIFFRLLIKINDFFMEIIIILVLDHVFLGRILREIIKNFNFKKVRKISEKFQNNFKNFTHFSIQKNEKKCGENDLKNSPKHDV